MEELQLAYINDLAIKKVHITLLHVVCTKDVAIIYFFSITTFIFLPKLSKFVSHL